MAVTIASLGTAFTTTAGDKTVTASPTLGDLIIIVAAATGVAGTVGATAVSDNQSGANAGTYSKIGSTFTGFSTAGGLDIWIRNKLITSNASTVFTASQASSTGGGLIVYRVASMSIVGVGAIRGAGGQSSGGAGATPAPVLLGRVGTVFSGTQAALTGNGIITGVANGTSPGGVTIRSAVAYTRDTDGGYTVPTTGFDVGHINSGDTASTLTWGGTSATAFASIAIEIDASVPQYDWVNPGKPDKDANRFLQGPVGRQSTWMQGLQREWKRAKSGIYVPELAFA